MGDVIDFPSSFVNDNEEGVFEEYILINFNRSSGDCMIASTVDGDELLDVLEGVIFVESQR